MSRRLPPAVSQRQRSSSGGEGPPPPLPPSDERRSRTVRGTLGKLKSKLSRHRSSQGGGGGGDEKLNEGARPPLLKSSTLPARMSSHQRPTAVPWGTASLDDSPTDDESVDSGLDPRGEGNSSSDSSPRNQNHGGGSIYDEISVQRAFGPAMKDLGRWFSQRQNLSLEAAEQDRLGSRPPLPIPPSAGGNDSSSRGGDAILDLYGKVEPRLLGSNGLELGLRDLAQYGWYWGPMTRVEAEERLTGSNDGTFLVRDSSDERYLLSLSFRSQGKTLHTRIEFCNGHFSFYSFPDSENEGYTSVAELIQRSMQHSSVGVFCFSRARTVGSPAVPVRLLKPLSRFAQIRSLQHYCRFVIRQTIRFDSIRELPLPRHMKGFLEQSKF